MFTVHFETFGCQMNVADSASVADLLAQYGYAPAPTAAEADLIVVNTCSVRTHAEQRARARISEYAAGKKNRPDQALWVVGCMAQRLGDRLREEIPGVDRVIGAVEIEQLHKHIREYLDTRVADGPVQAAGSGVCAFVPVMRGCDNFCSYCIVPHVRGREHSVALRTVVDSVHRLAQSGVHEVTLLGQNVNSYRDPDTGDGFPSLLRQVHAVEGITRIRFTTSHPKDCSEELVRTVAQLPRLAKHIHLPVQSGSTAVLRRMNRGYTRDRYLGVIDTIRRHMPGADITTDVMVGFPGESEDDFSQTLSLFRQVRFTTAFMFAFSPRPGTPAAGMEHPVPVAEAKARLAELIALQTAVTREIYAGMTGKTIEALFTERQKKRGREWMGQDDGCKRVLLSCDGDLAGMILPVKVRSATGMTLIAERT